MSRNSVLCPRRAGHDAEQENEVDVEAGGLASGQQEVTSWHEGAAFVLASGSAEHARDDSGGHRGNSKRAPADEVVLKVLQKARSVIGDTEPSGATRPHASGSMERTQDVRTADSNASTAESSSTTEERIADIASKLNAARAATRAVEEQSAATRRAFESELAEERSRHYEVFRRAATKFASSSVEQSEKAEQQAEELENKLRASEQSLEWYKSRHHEEVVRARQAVEALEADARKARFSLKRAEAIEENHWELRQELAAAQTAAEQIRGKLVHVESSLSEATGTVSSTEALEKVHLMAVQAEAADERAKSLSGTLGIAEHRIENIEASHAEELTKMRGEEELELKECARMAEALQVAVRGERRAESVEARAQALTESLELTEQEAAAAREHAANTGQKLKVNAAMVEDLRGKLETIEQTMKDVHAERKVAESSLLEEQVRNSQALQQVDVMTQRAEEAEEGNVRRTKEIEELSAMLSAEKLERQEFARMGKALEVAVCGARRADSAEARAHDLSEILETIEQEAAAKSENAANFAQKLEVSEVTAARFERLCNQAEGAEALVKELSAARDQSAEAAAAQAGRADATEVRVHALLTALQSSEQRVAAVEETSLKLSRTIQVNEAATVEVEHIRSKLEATEQIIQELDVQHRAAESKFSEEQAKHVQVLQQADDKALRAEETEEASARRAKEAEERVQATIESQAQEAAKAAELSNVLAALRAEAAEAVESARTERLGAAEVQHESLEAVARERVLANAEADGLRACIAFLEAEMELQQATIESQAQEAAKAAELSNVLAALRAEAAEAMESARAERLGAAEVQHESLEAAAKERVSATEEMDGLRACIASLEAELELQQAETQAACAAALESTKGPREATGERTTVKAVGKKQVRARALSEPVREYEDTQETTATWQLERSVGQTVEEACAGEENVANACETCPAIEGEPKDQVPLSRRLCQSMYGSVWIRWILLQFAIFLFWSGLQSCFPHALDRGGIWSAFGHQRSSEMTAGVCECAPEVHLRTVETDSFAQDTSSPGEGLREHATIVSTPAGFPVEKHPRTESNSVEAKVGAQKTPKDYSAWTMIPFTGPSFADDPVAQHVMLALLSVCAYVVRFV